MRSTAIDQRLALLRELLLSIEATAAETTDVVELLAMQARIDACLPVSWIRDRLQAPLLQADRVCRPTTTSISDQERTR